MLGSRQQLVSGWQMSKTPIFLKAAKQLQQPVAREDHGFYFQAFNNWPGPYMAQAEAALSPETILAMLKNEKSRAAYFELALVFAYPNGNTIELTHQVPCTIAQSVKAGEKDFNWDSIICPLPADKALSEYSPQDRYHLYVKNFTDLGYKITSKNQH